MKRAVLEAVVAETGGGDEALRARSVMSFAGDIKVPTLILNGGRDDRTDAGKARQLADEINRQGGNARAIIYPDLGHQIPVEIRSGDIDPFVEEILGE